MVKFVQIVNFARFYSTQRIWRTRTSKTNQTKCRSEVTENDWSLLLAEPVRSPNTFEWCVFVRLEKDFLDRLVSVGCIITLYRAQRQCIPCRVGTIRTEWILIARLYAVRRVVNAKVMMPDAYTDRCTVRLTKRMQTSALISTCTCTSR